MNSQIDSFHERIKQMPEKIKVVCAGDGEYIAQLLADLFRYAMETTVNLQQMLDAIRKHRDYRGDDRCWRDDEELYGRMPEGYIPQKIESSVELTNCQKFIECRKNPMTLYVSPERMIEQLRTQNERLISEQRSEKQFRSEIASLKAQVAQLTKDGVQKDVKLKSFSERIEAQAEILTKHSQRKSDLAQGPMPTSFKLTVWDCKACEGKGFADSGGSTAWSQPVLIPCPYCELGITIQHCDMEVEIGNEDSEPHR